MMGRRMRAAALCVLVAWSLVACTPTAPFGAHTASEHKTLTQNGGLRVNVQLVCAAGQDCTIFSDLMAQSVTAIEARAQHGLGVNDASAKALSAGQIEVDLPGYTNQQAAVSALTTQGLVQFIDTSGAPLAVGTKVAANQYPVLFTGSQIAPNSVSATSDQQAKAIVVFEFAGAARAQFAQYTNTHEGAYLTITLDHTVIESAQIQSEIDGQAEITGAKSLADAQALAADLKSSPLPLPVTLVSIQPVAASGA
jgi:preprotein translocase subunit SecD